MLKLNFLNNFMSNTINLNYFSLLIKLWSDLVVKTLVCFYECFGSMLDGYACQCILHKCNLHTCTSWWLYKHDIMVNGVQNDFYTKSKKNKINFAMACIFVTVPHNKNTIHDSMIWENKIFFWVWWCGSLF
jgi:hypothetical protein